MSPPPLRIDAHQHFWRYDPGEFGWIDDSMATLRRDFLPQDIAPLLMRSGFDGSVAVQARQSLAETEFLLDLAEAHAFIVGVVGWVDFESDGVADTIDAIAADPKLVGLRPMIQDIPDTEWMLEEKLAPAFEAMIDHGLVFDALVLPSHLPALIELCARYPDPIKMQYCKIF